MTLKKDFEKRILKEISYKFSLSSNFNLSNKSISKS